MAVTDDYADLLEKLAAAKREKAQAEGARAELLRQLKEKFGVNGVNSARKLAEELRGKKKRLKIKADTELKTLRERFKDK